jgi:hypothetical protein
MTDVRINGVRQLPAPGARSQRLTPERPRTIVQDSHLNFLIGAGTPSAFFARLGNIEQALTDLADAEGAESSKQLVRASIQAYFFENVLVPVRSAKRFATQLLVGGRLRLLDQSVASRLAGQ